VDEADFMADHPVHVEADSVVLSVDGAKVERIVENLVRVALRRSPARTTVDVRVEAVDGVVRLVVADHGSAIPEAARASLFEPFERSEDQRAQGGSGLTRAIVGRYVRLHSGRVRVENRSTGGIRCIVDLPLHRAVTDVPPASPSGDAALAPSVGTDATLLTPGSEEVTQP
jgi:signal transduction histidine kinase